ncbi:MAG: sodium:solute symporter [Acidobacteriota bacterium]
MILGDIDLWVLAIYAAGLLVFGASFARRNRTPEAFIKASGRLPGWAVGLSLFGTFLSSNTFLGVPGNAYSGNWNSYTFSLTLPFAAWAASRWFVPFYRHGGHVSAYHHLEERFGRWARTYAVVCYLLTQLARVGSILFGVSLALSALTGWSLGTLILASGVLVTFYTLVGGIEAVIWTDVVQSIVLSAGALLILGVLVVETPGGLGTMVEQGLAFDKFSLGSFGFDLTTSTFWVVFAYGLFINLNNFGIDQSYVQRFHAAESDAEARRSVWLAAALYVPISLLFFFLGTALFVHVQTSVPLQAELEALAGPAAEVGDRVLPHFIATRLPTGIAGLIVAALFSAAVSSVDTSLNSSATVALEDLWKPYVESQPSADRSLSLLRAGTLIMGVAGTGTALAMTSVRGLLDAWWTLSGIFAGGVLGLFLLGRVARHAERAAAMTATALGVTVILWMTLSPLLEGDLAWLRSPLHANLIIVFGTSTIFLSGLLFAGRKAPRS